MAVYGEPFWAPTLDNRLAAKLNACQRIMAIRIERGYRKISREAASPLAGLPPWDLEAPVLAGMRDLRVEMQRRGETPLQRQVAVWRIEFQWDLRVAWRLRLSQPSAEHAFIAAVSPLFNSHGKFGRFLHRIKEESTPG
ncbi:hypothetical protein PYW07_011037 [Mythimna separata]|uniref:Uncharacterized protein n=1 Tax=Mythimna separata TaxID=271217 RepID=A0AAD8DKW0_MYTSE|nr:hypothetical protein PYW07_011037 [Mythimna separata]